MVPVESTGETCNHPRMRVALMFEHYRGFNPDFATFAKGAQLGGMIALDRGRRAPEHERPKAPGHTVETPAL